MNKVDVLFKKRSFIGDVMFCVAVINKQKCCFVRKNRIASKPKRQCFFSSIISGKRIQGLKICSKYARNPQKIMLILVITPCYQGEMSNYLFPKVETVAQRCCKKGVLRNFVKFIGKRLCQKTPASVPENACARVSFLIKLQA